MNPAMMAWFDPLIDITSNSFCTCAPPHSYQSDYESGHVPVGQAEPDEDELPDLAANVEKSFWLFCDPHFSHT